MNKKKLLASKVSNQMKNMMSTTPEENTDENKKDNKKSDSSVKKENQNQPEPPIKSTVESKKASESNIEPSKQENISIDDVKIDSDDTKIQRNKTTNIIEKQPEEIEVNNQDNNTEEKIPSQKIEEKNVPDENIGKEENKINISQSSDSVLKNEDEENYEIETDENDIEIFSVRLVGRSDYMQFILSTKKITKAEYIRQLVDADMKKNMKEFSRYMTMAKQYKEFLKSFGK